MAIRMPDVFSKKERSKIMSLIKSKNTKLEVGFRKKLWSKGLRYKLHYKINGNPDLAIVSKKTAIFIDGCFWHKCPKHYREPSSNKKYWNLKIERNVQRAKEVNKELKKQGWKVLRFWEHDIKNKPDFCITKILKELNK